MKLELKHLSPYLPYRLLVMGVHSEQLGNDSSKLTRVEERHLLTGLNNGFAVFDYSFIGNPINDIKPILRPLSDLTKEIKHNGKKIKPYKIIYCDGSYIGFPVIQEVNEFILNPDRLNLCFPLNFWERLFEMHFDVFGLIDAGLAIDINTL